MIKKMEEKILHKQICSYLKLQYPDVIFITDASGLRVSIGEAKRLKKLRSDNGIPDIIIFKPNKFHHGLFLEVKSKTPYLKAGGLSKSEHIQEQNTLMERLLKEGYWCSFVWTLSGAIDLIDIYMNDKL